jgi:hypothetical protein
VQSEDLSGCCQKFKGTAGICVQRNDSDMLGVISQAKVFMESQAAKRVNYVQKLLLDYWKK